MPRTTLSSPRWTRLRFFAFHEVNGGDEAFRRIAALFAGVILGILVFVLAALFLGSRALLADEGLAFLARTDWNPVADAYGALPFLYGTLVSSFLALLLAVPVALGIAIFLTELAPLWLRTPLGLLVELLAAIPSVIYGLWGVEVLVPELRASAGPFLSKNFGFLPFFRGPVEGNGLFSAALILAIMILPTISSVSREVLGVVPTNLREGALALGSTRWEMLRSVVLPFTRTGLLGAVILGLGRALGETMAVTMVIGNAPRMPHSLFSPAATMASIIANQYGEAGGRQLEALTSIGLLLFLLTLLLNVAARVLVLRTERKSQLP